VTRVMVFLGAALLVVSIGSARQASAVQGAFGENSSVQALAAALERSGTASGGAARAQTATTGDQAKRIEVMDERSENVGKESAPLPQTSTILPLLGLIGLGSLVAGLFARR
jgi:hypothetical protein